MAQHPQQLALAVAVAVLDAVEEALVKTETLVAVAVMAQYLFGLGKSQKA